MPFFCCKLRNLRNSININEKAYRKFLLYLKQSLRLLGHASSFLDPWQLAPTHESKIFSSYILITSWFFNVFTLHPDINASRSSGSEKLRTKTVPQLSLCISSIHASCNYNQTMNVNIVIVPLLIIFTLIAFGVVIDHGPRLFTTKELHEIANAAIGGFVLVFFYLPGSSCD